MITQILKMLLATIALLLALATCGPLAQAFGGDEGKTTEMGRRFESVETGMSGREVETIMGAPEEIIAATDGSTIHVWRRQFLGFTRETAVAVFEADRLVMAIHSSGDIEDVEAEVVASRKRRVVPPKLARPDEAGEGSGARDAWASLPYIQWRLADSGGEVPELDAQLVVRFDGVVPGMSYEALVALLGEPERKPRIGPFPSCRWTWEGAELTISLEDDRVTAKRLETGDLEIRVRENAWSAEDKSDRGVRISVEL